jgi:hypothetical protein
MYPRLATERLRELATRFPADPRRAPGGQDHAGTAGLRRPCYVDLEDPRTREAWTEDPRFQLDSHAGRGLILDEAQAVPADLRRFARSHRRPAAMCAAASSCSVRPNRRWCAAFPSHWPAASACWSSTRWWPAETAAADADVARRWHRHWLCGGFPDAWPPARFPRLARSLPARLHRTRPAPARRRRRAAADAPPADHAGPPTRRAAQRQQPGRGARRRPRQGRAPDRRLRGHLSSCAA